MNNKKMIEWERFEKLEKKYSKLCLKHQRLNNVLHAFRKLPQAAVNSITGEGLFLKRINSGNTPRTGIIYLKSTKIRKNHCDVCSKRRKTTAHHIIPIRLKSVNKELSQIRIRICGQCELQIHPENGYEESEILVKKERQNKRLKRKLDKKAEEVIIPFKNLINHRLEKLSERIIEIPEQLSGTPKKISTAVARVHGRKDELKYLKGLFRKNINFLFGTTR